MLTGHIFWQNDCSGYRTQVTWSVCDSTFRTRYQTPKSTTTTEHDYRTDTWARLSQDTTLRIAMSVSMSVVGSHFLTEYSYPKAATHLLTKSPTSRNIKNYQVPKMRPCFWLDILTYFLTIFSEPVKNATFFQTSRRRKVRKPWKIPGLKNHEKSQSPKIPKITKSRKSVTKLAKWQDAKIGQNDQTRKSGQYNYEIFGGRFSEKVV